MAIFKVRYFLFCVFGAFPLIGHPPLYYSSSFGAPHPEAPAEMAQLAFLIGEWKLDTWFAQEGGEKQTGTASLKVSYALDGFGILMEGRYPREGETDFVSNRMLVFNTRLKKWIGSGINTLGNRKDFEGGFENGKLVLVQSGMQFGGRTGINRVTYSPISDGQFKLRYDYSADNGVTWREGTFGYTATKVH